MPGYPDDRLIAVNLDLNVTRVFHSDYFGESKKGGLRMWNKLVYDRGGLPLHAGCKVIPTARGRQVGLIVGPLRHRQDHHHLHAPERLAAGAGRLRRLVAGRRVSATEAGCFAKTFALNPTGRADHLRRGHPARRLPGERHPWTSAGEVDFFDESYTKNGRAVFSFSDIEAADAADIERPTSCWS